MQTTKFVRKSFDVDAVQVTADNMQEIAQWCRGSVQRENETNFVKVPVLRVMSEKQTKAFPTDWVLYAGTGFKVYTDLAFKKTFDKKVEEVRTPQITV